MVGQRAHRRQARLCPASLLAKMWSTYPPKGALDAPAFPASTPRFVDTHPERVPQLGMPRRGLRGLTTAASIWGTSAIGILVGTGFYLQALGLTLLFVLCMAVIPRLEHKLPAHGAIAATLRFREGYELCTEEIHHFLDERGLSIPQDSIKIAYGKSGFELQCLIVADSVARANALGRIALELPKISEIESFSVTHSSRA
jgi:hypothetical protein